MTVTFEQAIAAVGIVASLASWSWWAVSRITRSETEIKNAIDGLKTSTVSELKLQAQATAAMHQMNERDMRHLSDRIARVETTLGGITKVVVFHEGHEP